MGSWVASGILLQSRCAKLYSAFFVVWLVYCVLLGFSFPPFPPGSVRSLLFGIGVSVGGWLELGLVLCLINILLFH